MPTHFSVRCKDAVSERRSSRPCLERAFLRYGRTAVATALSLAAIAIGFGTPGAAQEVGPAYAAGREVVAGLDRIVTPRGVQETFEVTLGGRGRS